MTLSIKVCARRHTVFVWHECWMVGPMKSMNAADCATAMGRSVLRYWMKCSAFAADAAISPFELWSQWS